MRTTKRAGHRPRPQGSVSGFSLIEVLVAMAILAVAIIALANLFLFSIGKNAAAGEQSRLAALAQDKLEELYTLDYANAGLNAGTYTDQVVLDNGVNHVTVDRSWTILDNTPEAGTKTITVTIAGYDRGNNRGYIGRANRVSISLIKSGPLGGAIKRN